MASRVFKAYTRVRYAETDASGIVYYNNYFVYFELGRIEMFRALGLVYDRHLPIAETSCRFLASARFDDELEIRTWLDGVRRCGFALASEVHRLGPEPTLLARGVTAMVTADDQGRPIPLPPALRRALLREEDDDHG
jgi:acyl-CoA thioester hydrolase